MASTTDTKNAPVTNCPHDPCVPNCINKETCVAKERKGKGGKK
jgi:hypothetical protein